ncbi:hydroxyacid dehydrogenase [Roseomonas sp. NAR14]|uniref:Hydroxyacid dehydrogenase n=1 Tax=Roseomonas acroporae TaxID=2937791 RepID=A0A9X1Y9C6_9PROT|nr:hydroxyacid dehydrogenase [Roseomonas acroporae]MCK8784532.1 hydroxyacid dehydrogenase [Roseomonas acroporae]
MPETEARPNSTRVLIVETLGEAGLRLFRQRPDIEVVRYRPTIAAPEFRALLAGAVGVALGPNTRFADPELDAAPGMKVVARLGVGFDAVDVPALTARRVPLMVVGIANATSVAEQAFYMMIEIAKRGAELDRRVKQGLWHDRKGPLPRELAGHTVLVVGFGRIGTRLAPRCRAFGMRVLVHDPYVSPEAIREAGYEPAPDLDAALAEADHVSLHCPRNRETEGMFDAARLARMKPGAVLVNTARGGIVDEAALHDALVSGHLAGAGIDVFVEEPAKAGHPLMALPNVVLSPHMAGVTEESMAAMAAATARNILGVLDGAPNRDNAVNPEVLG